jgi:predicted CXXCH cytochrome family protein
MFSRSLSLALAISAVVVGTVLAQAPLGQDEEVAWSHAPYEVGECAICHEGSDPESPGPLTEPVNELCFQCHDALAEMLTARPTVHGAALDSCTNCHNPHNAGLRKLLLAPPPELCLECHDDIGSGVTVEHGALTMEKACLNCHDPHATSVEKLLLQLPYDLCVGCHGADGVQDDRGKELTNIQQLLDVNPVQHGPVAAKDCTACHQPHGGETFRLLVLDYPAKFYSPFEPANYELCFTCHDDRMVSTPETTTLTNFRDGERNLHFLHVNKPTRGRTCRACHEVHAAENVHIIRNGVPYGKGGWLLPINYEPQPNGGKCTKTCHPVGAYDRTKE